MPNAFRNRIIDGMLEGAPPGEARERARREMMMMNPATVMQAARAVLRFSSHDWVSNISIPTAVLVMTRDALVPARRQYRLAASIPGARVFEVEGDHLACARAVGSFVPALVRACEHVHAEAVRRERPRWRVAEVG
jgi:pimeloyl-ACP methyl ester carboxylesterase